MAALISMPFIQPIDVKETYKKAEKAYETGEKVVDTVQAIREQQKKAAAAQKAAQNDYDVRAALNQIKGDNVNFHNITGISYNFVIERSDGIVVEGILSPGTQATMYTEGKTIKRVTFSDQKNASRSRVMSGSEIKTLLAKIGGNTINLILK